MLRQLSLRVLIGFAFAALSLLLFAWLSEEVLESETARFDTVVRDFIHEDARPSLTRTMEVITQVGSPVAVSLLTLATAAAFWARKKPAHAGLLAAAVIGTSLLDYALKISFHRPRPVPFFDLPAPASFSFPSGHAMVAFSFYAVLAHLLSQSVRGRAAQSAIWLAAAVMILLVGISRIYLGVHYPTDVIGGYAAAAVWVATLIGAEKLIHRKVEPLSPAG